MENQDSFHNYFEDALKIHAICADIDLNENDARLLTYMHAKASESGKGIEYFFNPAAEDAEALEIMLGCCKKTIRLPAVMSLDERGQEALELILTIADKISNLDTLLAKECGLENRLSGELRIRLKLYQDEAFRDKMIDIYKSKIQPMLPFYDKEKIERAFSNLRAQQQKKDEELKEIMASINHDLRD